MPIDFDHTLGVTIDRASMSPTDYVVRLEKPPPYASWTYLVTSKSVELFRRPSGADRDELGEFVSTFPVPVVSDENGLWQEREAFSDSRTATGITPSFWPAM